MKDKRSVVPIKSRWVIEKGKWDKQKNCFVDKKIEIISREIHMEIIASDNGKKLQFIGGPTGFEIYYLSDIERTLKNDGEFCICGGTINRWPACFVPMLSVKKFIET